MHEANMVFWRRTKEAGKVLRELDRLGIRVHVFAYEETYHPIVGEYAQGGGALIGFLNSTLAVGDPHVEELHAADLWVEARHTT